MIKMKDNNIYKYMMILICILVYISVCTPMKWVYIIILYVVIILLISVSIYSSISYDDEHTDTQIDDRRIHTYRNDYKSHMSRYNHTDIYNVHIDGKYNDMIDHVVDDSMNDDDSIGMNTKDIPRRLWPSYGSNIFKGNTNERSECVDDISNHIIIGISTIEDISRRTGFSVNDIKHSIQPTKDTKPDVKLNQDVKIDSNKIKDNKIDTKSIQQDNSKLIENKQTIENKIIHREVNKKDILFDNINNPLKKTQLPVIQEQINENVSLNRPDAIEQKNVNPITIPNIRSNDIKKPNPPNIDNTSTALSSSTIDSRPFVFTQPNPSPSLPARTSDTSNNNRSIDIPEANRLLFNEILQESKQLVDSNRITKNNIDNITSTIKSFFNSIMSELDNHFMMQTEKIIKSLNDRLNSPDEYLFFCKTFVMIYITGCMDILDKDRVRLVYSSVYLHLISLYHPTIIELVIAIVLKRFPWIAGIKIDPCADREEYLKKIGFDVFTPSIDRNRCKDEKEYHSKVSEMISSSKFPQFMNKLDCYSMIYYTLIGTDIRYQIDTFKSNNDDDNRQLNEIKNIFKSMIQLKYEELYFLSLHKSIKATPIVFRPILIRNWINASSDMYRLYPDKLISICKILKDNHIQEISNVIEDNSKMDIFLHAQCKKILKNNLIACREDIKNIIKDNTIVNKYILADPQYR